VEDGFDLDAKVVRRHRQIFRNHGADNAPRSGTKLSSLNSRALTS
jgi:hypothetical protein